VIFFTDENISKRLAQMLDAFDRENEIRAHAQYFQEGVSDVVWMRAVSSWDDSVAVVCGDGRILKNEAEKRVLKECNLTFVYLASGWTRLPWEQMAWKAIKAWPSIRQEVLRARFPTLFEVSINGKIEQGVASAPCDGGCEGSRDGGRVSTDRASRLRRWCSCREDFYVIYFDSR